MIVADNPADLGFHPDRLARIPAFITREFLDSGRLPHAALLVGRGDDVAQLWSSGVATDAIFRIASMTKPMTSVAVMQMVEEGRMSLADPVTRYIPEWKNLGVFVAGGGNTPFQTRPLQSPMRIIDLLRHTAGLTYGFQERTAVDAAYRARRLEAFQGPDLEEMIAILADIPLQFDPGSSWNYSIATDVLGAILQRVDDAPLDAVIARRITDPLGMVDTHFQLPAEKADRLPPCFAYDPAAKMRAFDPAGAESAWAKPPRQLSGGGGMVSTLADYHRFCRMILHEGTLEGTRILSRKTLALMAANHLPGGGDLTQHSTALFSEAENAGTGFGLGFATTIDPAKTMVAGSRGELHWGGMFSTAFFVDPAEALIVIFMTQLAPSTTYPIRRLLKSMVHAALDD